MSSFFVSAVQISIKITMDTNPNSSIEFRCGAQMKNRFMLAPLTNQQSHDRYAQYEAMIACGATSTCELDTAKGSFDQLKEWYEEAPGWAFGYLSYDLKNDVEKLESKTQDNAFHPAMIQKGFVPGQCHDLGEN